MVTETKVKYSHRIKGFLIMHGLRPLPYLMGALGCTKPTVYATLGRIDMGDVADMARMAEIIREIDPEAVSQVFKDWPGNHAPVSESR